MYRHRPTVQKREELVDLFFTSGILTQNITLIIVLTGLFPTVDMQGHQLPLFMKCTYVTVTNTQLPSRRFFGIPQFYGCTNLSLVWWQRSTNFKGIDRAVRHFEAGDMQDIHISLAGLTKVLDILSRIMNFIFFIRDMTTIGAFDYIHQMIKNHRWKCCQINDRIVYIKASCLPSMKNDKYTVYLCLDVNKDIPTASVR